MSCDASTCFPACKMCSCAHTEFYHMVNATFKSHLSDLYQPHRISVSSPPDSGSLLVSCPPRHGTSCDVSTAEPFPLHLTFRHSPSRKNFPCFSACFSTDLPLSVKIRVGWALKPAHYCFESLSFYCAMVSLASETGIPKHFVICSVPRSGGLVRHFFQKAENHCGCGDL